MRRSITPAALTVLLLLCREGLPSPTLSDANNRGQLQSAVTNVPLAIAREADRVKITFAGTLEAAEAATGTWEEVRDAVSPFMHELNAPQRFFRARATGGTNILSIFASTSVVQMTLSGPFQQHFNLAFAGTPDGIFPPVRQKPYFDGAVQLDGKQIPASLRARGNSSLQECPFPKLKLKVSPRNRAGTPFADAREIKVGTHCAEGGSGNVGRLRDERATFREALAYETMRVMGYITPRVRRARIEYRDTSPPDSAPAEGWPVTRNALILDDAGVVAEGLGGRALDDEEITALTDAAFDEQLIAELELLHALLGNWDYALSLDGQGLWNTDVIELPNKQLVPMPGDFDLASFVTAKVRVNAPREYNPELGDVERQMFYQIEQLQQRYNGPIFAAARDRFVLERPELEALINAAEVDDDGRSNALRHVAAFFDALAAVTARP